MLDQQAFNLGLELVDLTVMRRDLDGSVVLLEQLRRGALGVLHHRLLEIGHERLDVGRLRGSSCRGTTRSRAKRASCSRACRGRRPALRWDLGRRGQGIWVGVGALRRPVGHLLARPQVEVHENGNEAKEQLEPEEQLHEGRLLAQEGGGRVEHAAPLPSRPPRKSSAPGTREDAHAPPWCRRRDARQT